MNIEEVPHRLGGARPRPQGGMGARLGAGFGARRALIALDFLDAEIQVRRFADGQEALLSRIARTGGEAQALARTLAPYRGKNWMVRDDVMLRLPAARMLCRDLQLPAAARSKLGDILRHELDRQSPVEAASVYYDYRVAACDPQTQQLAVALRIVARAPVDAALALCRDAGIAIAAIGGVGDESPADGGNLPADGAAALQARIRRHLVTGLALAVLLLALACVAGLYVRNQAAAEALEERVAQARIQAVQAERLEREIDGVRQGMAFLTGQKQHLAMMSLLTALTDALPDGSFLTELQTRSGEIEITGLSHAASSLIGRIDAAPAFAGAQFRAPLTQGPLPGTERFDIVFHAKAGTP